MSATATQPPLRHLEAASTFSRVDAEKGIIYGVSLITSGLTAKGHDLEVDKITLEQMLSCAEAKKKLPVKWNHKTGADAISGYLKNFRIEGRKLVGDWHLLKSHERFEHAIELASEMPESLGLSTSFRGEDELIGLKKFARCTELVSADLVASPAANPDGFFEEKSGSVDRTAGGMGKPSNTPADPATPQKEFSLADVMAGLTALGTQVQNLGGQFKALDERVTNFETTLAEQLHELEEEEDEDEGQGDVPTEFANGQEAFTYLSERLAQIEDAKEQAKVERAFAAFEDKVVKLTELNEQLLAENEAMALAIEEFSDTTGASVVFRPAAEGGGYTHELSVPETGGRKPKTEFEARVAQLSSEGKTSAEAINLARKENPGRYQKHLEEIGVMARSL